MSSQMEEQPGKKCVVVRADSVLTLLLMGV
jgi:hypothetical protein